MLSGEDQARQESKLALEQMLQREQVNDLRQQMQTAVALLMERTGMSHGEVATAITQRLQEQRNGSR